MTERLLTPAQVAEALAVGTGRVYQLARVGALPKVAIGRQVRFRQSDIEAFIATGGFALPGGWRRERAEASSTP